LLGVICAAVGIFVLNGIAIEFAGIMLGRIGLLLLPDQRRQGGADPRDRRGGPQRRFHSRIREDCPFLVQDVLFNALLCQADKDLAQIARALGEDGAFFEERAERTAHAMNEKLWDAEHSIYLDFDLVAQRLIYVYVAPNFVPLFAGIPN